MSTCTLESIRIQNYRSCSDTTFVLQRDLSVLIGPNGSGKTTVLRACMLLARLTQDQFGPRPGVSFDVDPCVLTAVFWVEGKKAILYSKIHLEIDEHNEDRVVAAECSWYIKDFTGSRKRAKGGLFEAANGFIEPDYRYRSAYLMRRMRMQDTFIPKSFIRAFCQIGQYVSGFKYYSATQFTNPSLCPVSFEIDDSSHPRRIPSRHHHERFLMSLYELSTAEDTTRYDEFFQIIGPGGIGLIDEIEFVSLPVSSLEYRVRSGGKIAKRSRTRTLIVPQLSIGRNKLSPNQLSEGTFKTLTLLFYIITQESTALLVEEPEVCVHHGLLASMVGLMKTYSDQKQIVVSTHSDYVVGFVKPRNVYAVRRDNKMGTEVSSISGSLTPDEMGAMFEYLESEGNLGEYWRHGGLE